MKKIIKIITAIVLLLAVACETNTYSDIEKTPETTNNNTDTNTDTNTNTGGTNTGTDTGTTTNTTYTNNIQSIMSQNCTSCHRSGQQSPSLTTYTQVKNAVSTGKLLCAIQATTGCKTMPPTGKMTQANIDLILLWKSQGYIE